jgi:LmbE family N-acetylglucosaminyl deacetylase
MTTTGAAPRPYAGTAEAVWKGWTAPATWPRLDARALARRRVVVVVAHPDDEVLAAGGLLRELARLGANVRFVWATDGEASHPASTAIAPEELGRLRRAETRQALRMLGLGSAPQTWLGLPDGDLASCADRLGAAVAESVQDGDVVITTWSGDGHPDHEACGRTAGAVVPDVLELPVWAWTWARPDDPRVPWHRARRVELDEPTRRFKAAAVACHVSQVRPLGPAAADAAVLPDEVLAHFDRSYEVVLA